MSMKFFWLWLRLICEIVLFGVLLLLTFIVLGWGLIYIGEHFFDCHLYESGFIKPSSAVCAQSGLMTFLLDGWSVAIAVIFIAALFVFYMWKWAVLGLILLSALLTTFFWAQLPHLRDKRWGFPTLLFGVREIRRKRNLTQDSPPESEI